RHRRRGRRGTFPPSGCRMPTSAYRAAPTTCAPNPSSGMRRAWGRYRPEGCLGRSHPGWDRYPEARSENTEPNDECPEDAMAIPYRRLDKQRAAVLLVDHQTGLLSLVRDIEPDLFVNNVLALADLARYFQLPTLLTTSFENGPNGPLL